MTVDKKAKELGSYFHRLKNSLLNTEKNNPLTCGMMSMPEAHTLLSIGDSTSLTMSEIAKELQLSSSSATNIIDNLETLGFVCRVRSTEDRRIVRVKLTEAGAEFHARLVDGRLQLMKNILGTLEAEEQKQLLCLFQKITTKLEEEQ